ncbi:uncharacterized protein [Penaeus vannamei]|uniref:uncharacterized protein n=1 Tax=Penaeus vannamei TaxID=6689 RepID=UPI00387F7B47
MKGQSEDVRKTSGSSLGCCNTQVYSDSLERPAAASPTTRVSDGTRGRSSTQGDVERERLVGGTTLTQASCDDHKLAESLRYDAKRRRELGRGSGPRASPQDKLRMRERGKDEAREDLGKGDSSFPVPLASDEGLGEGCGKARRALTVSPGGRLVSPQPRGHRDSLSDRSLTSLDESDGRTECGILRHPSCMSSSGGPTAVYFDDAADPRRLSGRWKPPPGVSEAPCPHCPREVVPPATSSQHCSPTLPSAYQVASDLRLYGHGAAAQPGKQGPEGEASPAGRVFLTETMIREPSSQWLPTDAGAGEPAWAFTDATARLSPTDLAGEDAELEDERLWNREYWRTSRSCSRCSSATIYANTSDPGAPEPTYENVFECALREAGGDDPSPWPAPPARTLDSWCEEPIYATVAGQLADEDEDEAVTAFRRDSSEERDSPPPVGPRASVAGRKPQVPLADLKLFLHAQKSTGTSPSSSTATLCPEDDPQDSSEGGDTLERRGRRSCQPRAFLPPSPAAAEEPPTLPPKARARAVASSPASESPPEDYGLRIRLPVLGEDPRGSDKGQYAAPLPHLAHPDGRAPLRLAAHPVKEERVKTDEEENGRGSLYVVIGSAAGESDGDHEEDSENDEADANDRIDGENQSDVDSEVEVDDNDVDSDDAVMIVRMIGMLIVTVKLLITRMIVMV